MRIVRLANFVAPHSGGLRTSLAELGAGYLAAGHEPVLVIPGERARRAAARARAERYDWGTATRGFLAAHGAVDGAAIRRSA